VALEEKSFIDMISWRPEFGHIEVRRSTVVLRDGEEVARTYHRHVVEADQQDLSVEDEVVQRIAALFPEERKAAAVNAAERRGRGLP
jgi:hypothetical protein